MSGWIDPLGTRALLRMLECERQRAEKGIAEQIAHGHSGRRLTRYRGRLKLLSRISSAVHRLSRPGAELKPYKALVQGSEPEKRHAMVRRFRQENEVCQHDWEEVNPGIVDGERCTLCGAWR